METKKNWKLIQQQYFAWVVCKCECKKPANTWNNGTGTCKSD